MSEHHPETTRPPAMRSEDEAADWLAEREINFSLLDPDDMPCEKVAFLHHRACLYDIVKQVDTPWAKTWLAGVEQVPLDGYWFDGRSLAETDEATSFWSGEWDRKVGLGVQMNSAENEFRNYLEQWFGDPWCFYKQYIQENFQDENL